MSLQRNTQKVIWTRNYLGPRTRRCEFWLNLSMRRLVIALTSNTQYQHHMVELPQDKDFDRHPGLQLEPFTNRLVASVLCCLGLRPAMLFNKRILID